MKQDYSRPERSPTPAPDRPVSSRCVSGAFRTRDNTAPTSGDEEGVCVLVRQLGRVLRLTVLERRLENVWLCVLMCEVWQTGCPAISLPARCVMLLGKNFQEGRQKWIQAVKEGSELSCIGKDIQRVASHRYVLHESYAG
ncbi:hypothetical protein E2C01_097279 [Portunus trituberculatus]|uniref:Uncharacterized protein n=1 Tax=Portunus trituberculatus TaxID=210409 RepID=A0A5B7K9J5_PORTR|nr:hypothetical protein [Portunus trituberculatus]